MPHAGTTDQNFRARLRAVPAQVAADMLGTIRGPRKKYWLSLWLWLVAALSSPP